MAQVGASGRDDGSRWQRWREIGRRAANRSYRLHAELLNIRTLRVLAIGLPLSFLAYRQADVVFSERVQRITELISIPSLNTLPLTSVIGISLLRITLVILYIYSYQPSSVYIFGSALGGSLLSNATFAFLAASSPFSLADIVRGFMLTGFATQQAVIGTVDLLISRRAAEQSLLQVVLLALGGVDHRHFLSRAITGLTIGTAYAGAALRVQQAEAEERKAASVAAQKEREAKEKWEREHAERERRAALPLIDNLRIIVDTPTAKLPVAIDFPRLANKMEVVDQSGRVLVPLVRDNTTPAELLMRNILLQLATCTGSSDLVTKIESRYEEFFEPNSATKSLDQLCGKFISTVIGDECLPVRILRACNQAAISPAVMVLKTAVGLRLPYKDIRGEWWIHVRFTADSVIVKHIKREQSWSTKPGHEFQFAWELRLVFNGALTDLTEVSLHIKDVTFADTAPLEHRRSVLDTMKAYLETGPSVKE